MAKITIDACDRCRKTLTALDLIDELCNDCATQLDFLITTTQADFVENLPPGTTLRKMLENYEKVGGENAV